MKKKIHTQRVMSQMQEMEKPHGQAMEDLDVKTSVKRMASQHVFLQRIWERQREPEIRRQRYQK